jgi:hypothetical protein
VHVAVVFANACLVKFKEIETSNGIMFLVVNCQMTQMVTFFLCQNSKGLTLFDGISHVIMLFRLALDEKRDETIHSFFIYD